MRARVFQVVQKDKNPQAGEDWLTEEMIKSGLAHKTIKHWAYILHDKDVHQDDDTADPPKYKAGDLIDTHWHVVMETGNTPVDIETIAKWFCVPSNMIQVPKGRWGFIECVAYLTHADDKQVKLGKTVYDDSCVVANFNVRDEIEKYIERTVKYGKNLSDTTTVRYEVLYNGMRLQTVAEKYPFAYMSDLNFLKKCRMDYLSTRAPMPETRINYYIEGAGGTGKNLMSKALAHALYPDLTRDEDCYFEVGEQRVPFDGYDGQPVLIWNDTRAETMLKHWGTGEIFDIFDSHPTSAHRNVKYGSIRLTNEINIVNGNEPYRKFLEEISGVYYDFMNQKQFAEDPGQACRRFPIIICLHESDFDILLNFGILSGTRAYEQYISERNVAGSFSMLYNRLSGDARTAVAQKLISPVIDVTEKMREKSDDDKIASVDDIPSEFKEYGCETHKSSKYIVRIGNDDDIPF